MTSDFFFTTLLLHSRALAQVIGSGVVIGSLQATRDHGQMHCKWYRENDFIFRNVGEMDGVLYQCSL